MSVKLNHINSCIIFFFFFPYTINITLLYLEEASSKFEAWTFTNLLLIYLLK